MSNFKTVSTIKKLQKQDINVVVYDFHKLTKVENARIRTCKDENAWIDNPGIRAQDSGAGVTSVIKFQ